MQGHECPEWTAEPVCTARATLTALDSHETVGEFPPHAGYAAWRYVYRSSPPRRYRYATDAEGDVDPNDLNARAAFLLDARFNSEHIARPDHNGDGASNGRDVQPFIDTFFGGAWSGFSDTAAPICEPSASGESRCVFLNS